MIEAISNPTCPDFVVGSITPSVLNGNSPYTYTWSTGSTSNKLENLSEGQYCITINDFGGCIKENCFKVGNIEPTVVNKTKPCQTCLKCGEVEKCEDVALELTKFNCNAFTSVCPATGLPVDNLEQFITILPNAITCSIACPDGTTILGTPVTGSAMIDPNDKFKCLVGATCTFANILYDGINHPFIGINGAGVILPEFSVISENIISSSCTNESVKKCVKRISCKNSSTDPQTLTVISTGTECVDCAIPFGNNLTERDDFNSKDSTQLFNDKVINIFPNPFTNTIRIDLQSGKNQKMNLKLLNIIGQTLVTKSYEVIKGSNEINLFTEAINTGLYFLVVRIGEEFFTQKLIKQ
jgi:hypothetical protein